jgi:hypothetical protein
MTSWDKSFPSLYSNFFICVLQRRMIKEEGSEGEEAVSLSLQILILLQSQTIPH